MFIEASFGLIAISLPSLKGVFKLKGVQALVAGFGSLISSLTSSSAARSRHAGAEDSAAKTTRANLSRPSQSEATTSREGGVESEASGSQWRPSSVTEDIELQPMPLGARHGRDALGEEGEGA